MLTWEWGMTQFARLAAIFTIGRIIYGGLVHVGVHVVVLSRGMTRSRGVVRIVIVEIMRIVVRISGFRKISGGPNSRHTCEAKLGKVDRVKISFRCYGRTSVGPGDVTTKGDEKFVNSSQFLGCADVKRDRARVKMDRLGALLVCDIIETLGHT